MIVYELMSTGHIVRLPNRASFPKVPPEEGEPVVVLLMPFNRMLIGLRHMGFLEKWIWGKNGDSESWRETFLYDKSLCRFNTSDVSITIGSEVSHILRNALLSELSPPGDHVESISVLKGFIGGVLEEYDVEWRNESSFISTIENFSELSQLRLAYWGIRKALSLGDYSMIGRIKIWAKRGIDVFSSEPVIPKMWVSVGKLPGNKGIAELEALFFTPEQLQKMSLDKNTSVVFRGDSGYLIRFSGQRPFGELSVTVWMYFPFYLWDNMRKIGLKPQEIVVLSWGYLDALDATSEMERYKVISNTITEVLK